MAEVLDRSASRIGADAAGGAGVHRQRLPPAPHAAHRAAPAPRAAAVGRRRTTPIPDAGTPSRRRYAEADRLERTIDTLLELARTGRAGPASAFDLVALVHQRTAKWRLALQREHRQPGGAGERPVRTCWSRRRRPRWARRWTCWSRTACATAPATSTRQRASAGAATRSWSWRTRASGSRRRGERDLRARPLAARHRDRARAGPLADRGRRRPAGAGAGGARRLRAVRADRRAARLRMPAAGPARSPRGRPG